MKPFAFAIAAGAALLAAAQAQAHVVLDKSEARIGKFFKAVLAVPHGCEGSATIRLTVSVPEGMIAVKPMPKPGWTVDVKRGAYARAYPFMHGQQFAEGVKEISWSGGRLEDSFYDEFTFSGFIAGTFKPGDVLAFPAVQDCETGVTKWVELAAAGQDPHALKYPAPLLHLAATDAVAGVSKGAITISSAWSRATPSGARVGAGYLTITNAGPEPDRLIAVSSDLADAAEIHEMVTHDGVMTMRSLGQGLAIAPGQTVTLAPGGIHLMLNGLKAPLVQGQETVLVLEFERAGKLPALLDILGVGAPGPATREGTAASGDSAMKEMHRH
ncbi:DUF1775 domain-containing protein [Bradyrhizobium sp. SZCCHNS2005]|uniref:DUF1775 domain-containing protein n=1 Tax=Bradyrhizobium sp. SZCCHNS2005 TaxID=3057303 RepID=UPI0028E805AB|nr:DUF1775 domain-containing protein [Bradyrhizobium sp. SZCCHNS2005]